MWVRQRLQETCVFKCQDRLSGLILAFIRNASFEKGCAALIREHCAQMHEEAA